MKNLFEPAEVDDVKTRIRQLDTSRRAQWGTMNVAQALAHCAASFHIALGEERPPRMLIGRIIGRLVKPLALGNDAPMRKNSPTVPGLVITDERDLEVERGRLLNAIDRFVAASPAGCARHPHSFFGRLTPDEWAVLMYKHLDHHLRQFGG